ncbi:MAG TPA: hypothetical protein VNR59_11495 [Gaiellaceae bacterium]|nr:hypothetical protein [Gaiellaceae bacterium]
MTSTIAAGLVLALASAAALNWGYFAQHDAASRLPPLSVRRPLHSLRTLFANARWFCGFAIGIGGWVLYVAALALAPLSLVQAASAGGVGLLALLVWRASGSRPRRREVEGIGLAIGGLVLLAISLAGQHGTQAHARPGAVAAWLGVSALFALFAVAVRWRGLMPGAGFGVAAGVLYAGGDVATKAVTLGGTRIAFAPLVLAFHGLAFVALQLGFQRGGALATAGVATLFTNALPIGAGTTIFHESIPGGALGVARIAAFAAVVAGASYLALAEAADKGDGSLSPIPQGRQT